MSKSVLRSALGAAVPHRKNTAAMETVRMPLPSRVVLPVSQHIGAPAVPVVKKGDHVDVGTLVAQPGSFVSAGIHSGVSGTVTDITTRMLANGNETPAIVITPDGAQTVDPAVCPPECAPAVWWARAAQVSPPMSSFRPRIPRRSGIC